MSRIIWYNDNFPLFPISENGGCESKKKIQGGLEVADEGNGDGHRASTVCAPTTGEG